MTQLNKEFLAKIESIGQKAKSRFSSIPSEKKVVVTSHDAFGYLGRELGIKFLAPVGISTDEEASAADIAKLIEQIKQYKVNALFLENINNPKMLKQISEECKVNIGGKLFSDALSYADEKASSYLKMMIHNYENLYKALK